MPRLDELGNEAHENAVNKGFYEDIRRLRGLVAKYGKASDVAFLNQIWYSHRLMLVVSELGEALEAIRDNNWSHQPKSGGVGEEVADAQIRLADLFTDLFPPDSNDAVVRAKMEYNASRPRKHGRSL
jgi:hypothetical protein